MMRSKSPLAALTRLSPNCTKPRTSKIRRLTPHCVAGNLSIEAILGLSSFLNYDPVSGASCNYAVGTDGRIGLGVEEMNRAWTTSSRTNDMEAVTFEIANNGGAPDWRMSDAAINAWLNLAVDICRTYGYSKVNYQPKPDSITPPQVESWIATWSKPDEMIITLHCWYSSKACPGAYFIRQLPWLVREMNKRLSGISPEFFIGEGAVPSKETSDISNNEAVVWNFLKSKGLSDFAVAGIMGNLFAESNLRPNNLQNTYEKTLGMTDEVYTKAVDNNTYDGFVQDKAGYGIAQWTYWSRKEALLKFAAESKTSISDLTMQLNFLWKEMQGYTIMMSYLANAATVRAASDAVLLDFERPADQSEAVRAKRAEYGQMYYDKFVTRTAPLPPSAAFTPYTVKIKVSALNVRKQPGSEHPIVKVLMNDNNVYTIVEESNGSGATKWCKLKSGLGWISKDFVSIIK